MRETKQTPKPPNSLGLLLVGHGTTSEQGTTEFERLAAQVATQWTHGPTEPGLLEFARPTIADGVNSLAERCVEEFLVMPLLLFAAGHAKTDIPAAVEDAVASLTPKGTSSRQIKWRQTDPLECHPKVVHWSHQRFQEACANSEEETFASATDPIEPKTQLLLVGRGSRDPDAIAKTHEFAQLRAREAPHVDITTCFYAMAEPSFDSVLNNIICQPATNKPSRVVVQPHLLFQGRLIDAIQEKTNAAAQERPDLDWKQTKHLGPSPALAEAVIEICEQFKAS